MTEDIPEFLAIKPEISLAHNQRQSLERLMKVFRLRKSDENALNQKGIKLLDERIVEDLISCQKHGVGESAQLILNGKCPEALKETNEGLMFTEYFKKKPVENESTF